MVKLGCKLYFFVVLLIIVVFVVGISVGLQWHYFRYHLTDTEGHLWIRLPQNIEESPIESGIALPSGGSSLVDNPQHQDAPDAIAASIKATPSEKQSIYEDSKNKNPDKFMQVKQPIVLPTTEHENRKEAAPEIIENSQYLYRWICFSCLYDASTFFADLGYENGNINRINQNRRYKKFKYFQQFFGLI